MYWKDSAVALRTRDGANQPGFGKSRKLGSSGGLSKWRLIDTAIRLAASNQLQFLSCLFKFQNLVQVRSAVSS